MTSDNLAAAPADVAQRHVTCACCREVLHQGAPGAKTSWGLCEPCKTTLGPVMVREDGVLEFLA